jgi:hypothetical protein
MNIKNLVIASLAGSVVSLFIVNVPVFNLVNCLLCVGLWGCALLAVGLYRRMTGSVSLVQAVVIGTLTGIWAAFFGLLLSLIGRSGAAALITSFREFLPIDHSIPITTTGGKVLTNLAGAFIDVAFGIVGGVVGGLFFKTRK